MPFRVFLQCLLDSNRGHHKHVSLRAINTGGRFECLYEASMGTHDKFDDRREWSVTLSHRPSTFELRLLDSSTRFPIVDSQEEVGMNCGGN